MEYELLDTGIFDGDRYFDVGVEYAKQTPEDILIQISVSNRGPEAATLHVLPTLWFRNIWAWWPDLMAEACPETAQRTEGQVRRAGHSRAHGRTLLVLRRGRAAAVHRE